MENSNGRIAMDGEEKHVVPVCNRCLWYFPHWEDEDFDCLCGRDVKPMLLNKQWLDELVEKNVIQSGQLELPESLVKGIARVTPCPDFEIAHFMLVSGWAYTPKQVYVLREIERRAKRLSGEEVE